MAELKARLQADLARRSRRRETTRMAALRMALAAVTTEEVAGDVARELSDAEVQKVLTREVKKRKEAAEAFAGAGRAEQRAGRAGRGRGADRTTCPRSSPTTSWRRWSPRPSRRSPTQLGEAPGQRQMGQVMKAANAKVAGRAEGGRVAAVGARQAPGLTGQTNERGGVPDGTPPSSCQGS